jgi:aspartate racemase
LVLRSDLSGNPTFGELLDRVRKTALEAYDHQDFPFEKLVEELQPERSLSYSPLFQVMFVLQNTPPSIIKLGSLRVNSVRMAGETAKFDLTLSLHEEAGELKGYLQYNTDLFATATIKRMLGHFGTLLEGIVSNPQARVSELPILTDAEKHQLLMEWNDTERDYPKDKRIEQLFEEQVERTPDAVSVVFDGQELTYRELNSRANQLAGYLQKQGVVPETLVGICMERSLEMVVGILGVLKAGGAYVPLDPSYPSQRLAFMIRDSRAEVILTQRLVLEHLRDHRAKMIALDRDWDEIAEESPTNGQIHGSADSIAYVMYTSGSTGEPKGVEIPHRGIARLCFGVDYVRLDANQTFLHMAPIAFDASTFEIWGALLHGARCALYPKETPSPKELAKLLKKHQVSTLWLTSALFNTVIDEAPEALKGVSQLLIGGEALSTFHVERALALLPQTQIINGYGPTESTTFTCCYPIPRELSASISSIPIGRPIGNSQVYILDRCHQPVPIGVTGELYIGGDGLARCYLNQPELTDQKFMLNPFSRDPQSRLYKTGDLGRYLQDGNIEFIGRTDNQVKIRGYRIELGEIEAVLGQHPGIREVKVLAYEDHPGDKKLAAYIVIETNQPATGSDLRNYLREKLPGYMIPSVFISLDSLPLTPNGKVDYRALPDPHGQYAREKNAYVAPRDGTEEFICQLWSGALKIDRVGIDDDFFSLGGHSLLAAKLFARLDEKFGRSLPLGVLFAAPTIRSLAERYRTPIEPKARSVVVSLRKAGALPPIFAVPGVFGNVVCFADLASELGFQRPFYGLQSLGLDGTEPPVGSIEEMARLYVKEMQSIQADGPYVILGACFGATVAYEMTRQLLAAGEEVGFLGLLDPTRREGNIAGKNPESIPRIFRRAAAFRNLALDRLQLYREEMRKLCVIDRVNYLAAKFRMLSRLIGNKNAFKGTERELNQIEVYRANLLALDVYRREPLDGRLRAFEVFETTRPGRANMRDRIDWQAFWKGPIKNHKVPGKDSGDMLSGENARVLGALITQRLHLALHASQQLDCLEPENGQGCLLRRDQPLDSKRKF